MKPLPATTELLRVARRVVWFQEPRAALADPRHFLAHVMTYGAIEDLAALQGTVDRDAFIDTLDHAPPGVFDAKSWTYWHLRLGREPDRPLPVRKFSF